MAATALRFRDHWINLTNGVARRRARRVGIAISLAAFALAGSLPAAAQVNGQGRVPLRGWSTFSQQTIASNVMNEQNILAQSDAMRSSGLGAHGFQYINLDAQWNDGEDGYGRPLFNPATFPTFIAMIQHIHANGQKVGIYLNPGMSMTAVQQNLPIYGTNYHAPDVVALPVTIANVFGDAYKIDYSKPGAQAYINSMVDLFTSWGIDYIKLDAVSPGSYSDNLNINTIPDVRAFSQAIAQSGSKIWLTVSWALDEDFLSDWQQNSNARRIEGDVECEGDCPNLTEWQRILVRFYDLIGWENASGPTLGWNDMDSLEVGNTTDGITETEQQTATTLWSLANAPLSLGGDLTKLTPFGLKLLTNDEVLGVQRSGHPAKQVNGGFTPVWVSDLGDGTYYVGIFNLNAFATRVQVDWKDLGFAGASQIRDLWNHVEVEDCSGAFSAVLPGHGARLLRVRAVGKVPTAPAQIYGAQTATLFGNAQLSDCPTTCASGSKLTFLGIGAANYAVFNVNVQRAGTYRMEVDSMTLGTRSFIINVNNGPGISLNLSGGSGNLPFPTTIPVQLKAGANTIQFGNPVSYPPDVDRIIISGDGTEPYPDFTVYEAEYATLAGQAATSAGFCGACSGLAAVGNLGGSSTVTFENVTVPVAGTYLMEVDYMTQGQRSFFVSVDANPAQELDLNGYSFGTPTNTLVPVKLHAGVNQIEFSNPNGAAPNLDSIVISAQQP